MAEVVNRIHDLTHIRFPLLGCSDDDGNNRLNHRHTVIMLLTFSVVITSRLFISDLIICWTPGEFTGNIHLHIPLILLIDESSLSSRVKHFDLD